MAQFSYTAEKTDGEQYQGVAQAADRFELYQIVRREGGHIVSVHEEGGHGWLDINALNARFSTVKEYDKVLFARNLGAMLSAGLSLARALAVLERQTTSVRLKAVVAEISNDVRKGETLHEGLAKYPNVFSNLMASMVKAGEEGGDLPQSLQLIADQMERMYNLKKKVKGALMYPSIILIAIVGIGVIMMVQVVPTLAQTFKEMGAQLPAMTRGIIAVSDFLIQHAISSVAIVASVITAFVVAGRTPQGLRAIEWVLLHLPVIGTLVKETNSARTARTLSSLLTSGVDVLTALDITGEVVQNSFFRDVIKDAKTQVQNGKPLSLAFENRVDLYPPFVSQMMAVGEETGATNDMLKRLAIYYEEEVDRSTKDLSTIIEPFLMLFIGGGVGFFAMAMISPIYQLSQNI